MAQHAEPAFHPPSFVYDARFLQPQEVACRHCGTRWVSRVPGVLAAMEVKCVKCGGSLRPPESLRASARPRVAGERPTEGGRSRPPRGEEVPFHRA